MAAPGELPESVGQVFRWVGQLESPVIFGEIEDPYLPSLADSLDLCCVQGVVLQEPAVRINQRCPAGFLSYLANEIECGGDKFVRCPRSVQLSAQLGHALSHSRSSAGRRSPSLNPPCSET